VPISQGFPLEAYPENKQDLGGLSLNSIGESTACTDPLEALRSLGRHFQKCVRIGGSID